MAPKIISRLWHIRERLPDTKLRLYTNGHGMTPKRIDELKGLGMDHLYVSVNTLVPEKCKDVRGIPLKRTFENLEYLTEGNGKDSVAKNVTFRMTRLADTTVQEQKDFQSYCREHGVRCFFVGLFNYKGDVNSPLPVPSYGYEHIGHLNILAAGRVTLCCMDQHGEYGWGDANEMSVLELYNHPKARQYRELHRTGRRKEIEPCGTCNLFCPCFKELSPAQKVKTGAEYLSCLAKYRPTGVRPPPPHLTGGGTLIQLKTHGSSVEIAK